MNKISLDKCPLFAGLNEKEIDAAFNFFDCRKGSYRKGELLGNIGEKLDRFGLVLDGCVQIYTLDIDGSQMIMSTVTPGETFGESLSFLRKDTSVFISAMSETNILWLSTENLRTENGITPSEKVFVNRFISLLANRALSMNDRIQILSKLTIREKLIAFFTESVRKYRSYSFKLPFDRNDMAIYLGCDRCALSRELSKMSKEGIITFSKNSFTVNKRSEITNNDL